MTILKTGDIVTGRYEVAKYLDAGGMQEVYIAKDKLLGGRHVALKTPFNNSAAKRFKRSAEFAARMNHPNVAKTFDYLEEGGRQFLVEELVNGQSLEDLLSKRFHYFDPHLLAQFGHHFSKAIRASHHVGVVHRDLKPSNIVVEDNHGCFVFKVTDFGVAKLMESELTDAEEKHESIVGSGSSTIVGALPYMAPEIIDNHKQATSPADVWAFGAILYRVMTGELPFGKGLAAVPKIHSGELPPRPALIDKAAQFRALGSQLWQVVEDCLKKEPKDRPDAKQLVERFATMSYAATKRVVASVKTVRPKGYPWGFLTHAGNELFYHEDSFFGDPASIKIGMQILCSTYEGGGSARAHPLLPLK